MIHDQDIQNAVVGFLSIAFAVLIFIYSYKKSVEYKKASLCVLNEKLLPIKDEIIQYKFYTTGHPYVWVESSYSEICKKIEQCCQSPIVTPRDFAPGPAQVFVKIDKERKAVYVVAYRPNEFNTSWPKLMHYQEWLESNKQVAENISKYKEAEGENA